MKMNKKMIVILITTAVVCIAGGTGVFLVKGEKRERSAVGVRTPKPAEQSNEEITGYFQSEQFQSLDPNDRRDYARQAVRQMMANNVEGYFETPKEERVAYLDEIIDSMQNRREMFRGQRGGRDRWRGRDGARADGQRRERGQGQAGRRGRGRNLARSRERAESRDPAETAKRSAFRQAMRDRMNERGIESRWGGRGGW